MVVIKNFFCYTNNRIMDIFLNILFLIIGMVLLVKGADFFVAGASSLARKMKVSSLVVGLTIVAIGTSLPELAVSVASAIKGNVDLSVGNIIGSNMANLFLIIGVVAIITQVKIHSSSKTFDFPALILVSGLLLLFCCDTVFNGASDIIITRTESVIFLGILIFYIVFNVRTAKKEREKFTYNIANDILIGQEQGKAREEKILKGWQIALCLIFGLVAVVFGGECVSRTSQFLAIKAGMSEALVGITIVALGTSLPELATSIAATKRGETDLAIGNLLGSCILNIVLILGLVGIISQINVSTVILTDLIIMFVTTVIFVLLSLRKMKLGKLEGIIFLAIYIAYIAFAIVRNYCF